MSSPDNTNTPPETTRTDALKHKRLQRRRLILRSFAGLVIALVVAFGIYHFLVGRWYESTDDAYVSGNVVHVTSQIPGTVVNIKADNNDFVHKGQVLVTLDRSNADIALTKAKAALAQTVRHVRSLYSTVRTAKAEVDARIAVVKQAKADYDRRHGLAESGAISTEALAHARDRLTTAKSALAAAQATLATAQAQVSGTTINTQPDVKAAAAAVREAWLNDQRTTLRAPITGHIAKRTVQVGQSVTPSTPLMAVIPLDSVWVDANFKETQMREMRIGQSVTLESDIYGSSVTYHGHIQGLGMGTGSAFSLLPAQNASGNWIKIVQRIPVKITLNADEIEQHPLRIGMSMSVTVNLRNQKGPRLATVPATQTLYSTNIYSRDNSAANKIIAHIIHANSGQSALQLAATRDPASPVSPH